MSSTANEHSAVTMRSPAVKRPALLERAPDALGHIPPHADLKEVWRPPGLETPGKHALIEALRAVDIVGVDREVRHLSRGAQRG